MGHDGKGRMRAGAEQRIRAGIEGVPLALQLFERAERWLIYPQSEYGKPHRREYAGIRLHSHYEAKLLSYLEGHAPDLINPGTCFWIVDGEPKLEDFTSRPELQLPRLELPIVEYRGGGLLAYLA